MDFNDILAQASHNAQKATKVVKTLDQESSEKRAIRRQQYEQELAREREERRRKAPPKVEKKFVIPKKKNPADAEVSSQGLQSFLEKQRREQIQKEIQKKKDRDKLIGLRLQANQGKASKKIASHFGKSAIELQQRYAPNSHMEMELLKRQQREQEELEQSSSALRHSIDKAKKDRAAILARVQSQSNGKPKQKARVGNVKAGGFSDVTSKQEEILTKRKAENFSTFASNREKPKKPRPQNGTAAALDFSALMAQAQQNTNVGNVAAKTEQTLRTSQTTSQSNSREVMKRALNEQMLKKKPLPMSSSSSSKPTPSSSQNGISRNGSSSNNSMKRPQKVDNPYALSDRHVLGPPQSQQSQREMQQKKPLPRVDRTVPPFPQPHKKEQRILPGDIRYKGPPPSSSSSRQQSSSTQKPVSSADAFKSTFGLASSSSKDRRPTASQSHQSREAFKRPLSPDRRPHPSSSQRYDRSHSSSMSRKPERRPEARPRSNPAMFGKRSGATSSSYISGHNYSDEESDEYDRYDDEDEYDSEMDDFIDDTDVTDLEKADFEESLRSINRNYDKRRWQMNERLIDERSMQANYRDIEAEEKRSSKLAIIEDYREAVKGSKGLT